MNDSLRASILRTLSCHEAWGYAPTMAELALTLDAPMPVLFSKQDIRNGIDELLRSGEIIHQDGRLIVGAPLAGALVGEGTTTIRSAVISSLRDRAIFQPRKLRQAQRVARWLARLSGVRFVALANTTSWGYARDFGDLDFFVIVRAGTIWTTRLFGAGLFKILGRLAGAKNRRDAVCLSYFIADDSLDLSSHMLESDPYFRQWFLALLPIVDDGVSAQLWHANTAIRSHHPFALPWMVAPDLRVTIPRLRFPSFQMMDRLAQSFQRRWFPLAIHSQMNQSTSVMVSDHVLKFHVEDARKIFHDRCEELCRQRGVEL